MTKQSIEIYPSIELANDPISCLTSTERDLFWNFGTGPSVEPTFPTIHQSFEAFAKSQPNAIAVEFGDTRVTYGEVDTQATILANYLIEKGIQQGDSVGLFLKRSPSLVIAIMACLKIGAAYIPQDAEISPITTLQHIVNNTETRMVLSESKHFEKLSELQGVELTDIQTAITTNGKLNSLPEVIDPGHATSFILFTSGTTGKPNGVRVSQKNLCNILLTHPGNLGIQPGIKVAHILNIAFDMAAWEILGCLANGGTLLIRGKDFQQTANKANVIIATPSILGRLNPETCTDLKRVAVAGEPCPLPLAELWSNYCEFNNSCGPTETTIINTLQLFEPGKPLTIGKPTPNNTVYVLDDNLLPCAIGETGEMWAGGDCVTQGYLNNPELTNQRYLPDPFLGDGKYMFKTRDLGRWTENGELEHLGRSDDQVKVKGFRVELDGVSKTIEKDQSCEKAVTLKLNNDALIAFCTPASANLDSIQQQLDSSLPYYAVPQRVIAIDEIPITDRGKADKRELLKIALNEQTMEAIG